MGGAILMPYYHCSKCHHEFESILVDEKTLKCNWCGADKPIVLEEKTPLEKMCSNVPKLLQKLREITEKEESND